MEYTDLAKKQADYSADSVMPRNYNGRVRIAHGVFVSGGTVASGSKIALARLPKGAKLLGSSKVYFPAGLDASFTAKVGDSLDDDRYLVAVAPGTTAKALYLDANVANDTPLAGNDYITLTTGGAVLAASVTISAELYFVID